MLTPGIDTYNTPDELETYAKSNGIDLSLDKSMSLKKAMEHIESMNYSGSKTNPSQALEFPRNGNEYVPGSIKKAQLVVACLIDSAETGGGDMYSQAGDLDYFEIPDVNALLKPFISTEPQEYDD